MEITLSATDRSGTLPVTGTAEQHKSAAKLVAADLCRGGKGIRRSACLRTRSRYTRALTGTTVRTWPAPKLSRNTHDRIRNLPGCDVRAMRKNRRTGRLARFCRWWMPGKPPGTTSKLDRTRGYTTAGTFAQICGRRLAKSSLLILTSWHVRRSMAACLSKSSAVVAPSSERY